MDKLHIPCSMGCFVCGYKNEFGLQTEFYVENNFVRADINFANRFAGFPNVTHGGILASILDESMGWAAYIFSESKNMFYTRKLEVTYKKNTPIEAPIHIFASFLGIEKGLLFLTKAHVEDSDGKKLVAATGQFFPIGDEKMNETRSFFHFHEGYTYHPKALLLKKEEK